MDSDSKNLFLLANKESLLPEEVKRELQFLGRILYEKDDCFKLSHCNEVIDINRRKVIRPLHLVQQVLEEKRRKAFVFIFNKN
jgi:hypothetical protein